MEVIQQKHLVSNGQQLQLLLRLLQIKLVYIIWYSSGSIAVKKVMIMLSQLAQELTEKASQLSQWEGNAGNAYVRKLMSEREDVMDCVRMVKSRAQELINMAMKYSRAESANTSAASALATDVVQG